VRAILDRPISEPHPGEMTSVATPSVAVCQQVWGVEWTGLMGCRGSALVPRDREHGSFNHSCTCATGPVSFESNWLSVYRIVL
jgi:hypothetical protein